MDGGGIDIATELSAGKVRANDGTVPSEPIYISVSRVFYGTGGAHAVFTDREVSRALAKMSMDETDVYGDLSGLTDACIDEEADRLAVACLRLPAVSSNPHDAAFVVFLVYLNLQRKKASLLLEEDIITALESLCPKEDTPVEIRSRANDLRISWAEIVSSACLPKSNRFSSSALFLVAAAHPRHCS